MINARIFTEGPDDVAALSEILFRWHNAAVDRSVSPSTAREREHRLRLLTADKSAVRGTVAITALGKRDGLDDALMTFLRTRPIDATLRDRAAVVYDPDERATSDVEDALDTRLRSLETEWMIERNGPAWTLTRKELPQTIHVRTIAWTHPGAVLGGLPDRQNLERVLCAISARAWPAGDAVVAQWLQAIREFRANNGVARAPTWKAAVHLWCALVDDAATEAAAVKRFLGQNPSALPFVRETLDEARIVTSLEALFA